MVLEEMNAMYRSWTLLQQPTHPDPGVSASFRALLAAVDQGWRVEEPVQVMPSARRQIWTYYFVLFNPVSEETFRLLVPALPEVERYVEQNHYSVIEGSYYL